MCIKAVRRYDCDHVKKRYHTYCNCNTLTRTFLLRVHRDCSDCLEDFVLVNDATEFEHEGIIDSKDQIPPNYRSWTTANVEDSQEVVKARKEAAEREGAKEKAAKAAAKSAALAASGSSTAEESTYPVEGDPDYVRYSALDDVKHWIDL